MKNKLLLYVTVVLILSSCAGKLGITKRRYTKGYFVSHQKGKHITKEESTAKNDGKKQLTPLKETIFPTQTVSRTIKSESNFAIHNENLRMVTAKSTAKPKSNTLLTPVASASKMEIKKDLVVKPIVLPLEKAAGKTSASDDGVKLVIMVILCLFPFINLIPVYMHDGDFTLNFLITLLLDFTLIGGVIFALLVVLDVVDLR